MQDVIEKLKLLYDLNTMRLKETRELREITKEQCHRDFYDGQITELKRIVINLEDVINKYGIRNQHILSTPPLEQPSRLVNNSSCSVTPPYGITNKDVLKNLDTDLTGCVFGGKHF